MKRPQPPETLGTIQTDHFFNVAPALDMPLWIRSVFMASNSNLYNPDHDHLLDHMESGQIGFLWSAGGYEKQGRTIIGMTEELSFRCGYWQKLRMMQQYSAWFGLDLPEFIITLDADYCRTCSDAEFCALVEHELCHIAHASDRFGEPAYSRDTGRPKLSMRAHDVEEFFSVVRRYGPNRQVAELVEAAKHPPLIAHVDIASACGTCMRLVA